MKKIISLASVLVLFSFIGSDIVLTKVSSKLTMGIHKNLALVPTSNLSKYETQIAPMAVYESGDQEAKLVIRLIQEAPDSTQKALFKNPDAKKTSDRDIKLEHLFRKSAIQSQFDQVVFHQDTIKEVNERPCIVYEYTSSLSGVNQVGETTSSETYVYYQLYFIKNKTYVLNFYCPADDREEWQSAAAQMMNSVKIKS